ncbi:CapA family protein [Rhodopirellula sp. JC639]|uniref:CapA family protein n=1 Tax=Stieleria mannarensis TaxID=2755585 RepID=UPI001601A18A|nr:CapA family protein [Rhodopirellula sp. JC639]
MLDTSAPASPRVRLAAVGDLLLNTPPAGVPYRRCPRLVDEDVARVFAECDIVFGNLECTFVCDDRAVPAEPRVIADPEFVRAVKDAGFDVVTLANNHMFDGFECGFKRMRGLLDEVQLPHFGAGMNLNEATAPAILESNGLRIAFVGAVDHRSGPYQFASDRDWGVAPLDLELLIGQTKQLRSTADHVVVSIHWGEERFLVPSPAQQQQARALVDAGASLILGHHPHVLQGLEIYQGTPIIYSMGNFLADGVYFSDGGRIHWNRTEQTGCILVVQLTAEGVRVEKQIATVDRGQLVAVDHSGFGDRRIEKTARAIAGGVTPGRYRREHLRVKTLWPTIDHLRPSKLMHLRPRHFKNALRMLLKSRNAE